MTGIADRLIVPPYENKLSNSEVLMANGGGQMKLTYLFGWITAVAAFAYKALTLTSAGLALANRIRVAPYQLLETSALLFLICIAQATLSLVDERSKSGAVAAGK